MKKQFIWHAMKDWEDSHDLDQKQFLLNILKNHTVRHYPLMDETIFINNHSFLWTREHPTGYETKEKFLADWSPFMPDLLFPMRNMIVELDGDFHRNTNKGIRQTKRRNQYYDYAGIKLVVFETSRDKKYDELNTLSDKQILARFK